MRRMIITFITALAGAALAAGGAAVYALAGHQPGPVPSITGCLTSTAKLVKLKVGDEPKGGSCGAQTEVHLSGGDITAVLPAAGGGLVGGGANGEVQLGLADAFKLPQGCKDGDVAKLKSGAWVCGQDENTQYDGTDFALSNQACPSGAVVTSIDATGVPVCVRRITSTDGQTRITANNGTAELVAGNSILQLQDDLLISETLDVQIIGDSGGLLTIDSGGTRLGHASKPTRIDGSAVNLRGTSCPGVARRGDPVVVSPQNGVGSIVGGSGTVFAC